MANEFKIKKGLIVQGSGSTILDIQGSQGQLFSVTDSLSGSLFSVNDISGIPIMEVFSDDSINLGTFGNEAIKVIGNTANITGSLFGTASFAVNASTASFVPGYISGSGTSGQVSFFNGTNSQTGDNGLFWDNTNKRLGVGTNVPANTLHIKNLIADPVVVEGQFGSSILKGHVIGFSRNSANYLYATTVGGDLRFTVNGNPIGSPSVIFDTNGNVGIGTTSPGASLDILATSGNVLRLGRTGYDTYTFRSSIGTGLELYNTTDLRSEMFFDGAGNVGIGTTSPGARIDIVGGFDALPARMLRQATYGEILRIGRNGVSETASINYPADGVFAINTASTERMRIDSTGNVGIGTTSPTFQLDVSRTGGTNVGKWARLGSIIAAGEGAGSYPSIGYNIESNVSGFKYIAGDFASWIKFSQGGLQFNTAASGIAGTAITAATSMAILQNGNVGIGTTSPQRKLDVNGTVRGWGSGATSLSDSVTGGAFQTEYINNPSVGVLSIGTLVAGGGGIGHYIQTANSAGTIAKVLSINPFGGNVGIGTTTPNAKLDVNGNAIITGSLNQGLSSTTSANYSHAEGYSNQSTGLYSHAEGYQTISSGESSHAEGRDTIASGSSSHAEGFSTIALGTGAHAEGGSTSAIGTGAHAEGLGTVALGAYQHTQGQYNISSSAQSAFIVGNGTSISARSNLIFASGSQVQITGSLTVTAGMTGSLFGTASSVSSIANNVASNTNNYVLTATGGSTIQGESSLQFDGNSLTVNGNIIAGAATSLSGYTISDGVSSLISDLNSWPSNYATGEILYNQTSGEPFAPGMLVVRSSDTTWINANATTADEKSINLIGISLSNSNTSGDPVDILLHGFATTDQTTNPSATEGSPVYISTTNGTLTDTAPSNGGEVIRIVGHTFYNDVDQANSKYIIRFNPDNTWIQL